MKVILHAIEEMDNGSKSRFLFRAVLDIGDKMKPEELQSAIEALVEDIKEVE